MANRPRKTAQSHTKAALEPSLLRRSALSLAIAAALPFAAVAQDQMSQEEQDDMMRAEEPAMLEEVVVTSFRRSLETSRNLKMANESIVEAVSAEEIGKLPDVSIAESLARLPGLTAQRLNGRGQVISVRGLAPDFTTALLNGRQQVSTGDNRGVEFDQYPSELLSSVVVYKTPDAALQGQGLAGTADMRTIRPLRHGKRTIAGNLRYEKNDLNALNADASDDGERFTLSYVDQFADDTVGIALGIAHMTNPSQGERYNAWGYPGVDGDLALGGAKPFVRSSELERQGFMGALEYEPSDTFSTSVDLYYSQFEEEQLLRGIEIPLVWGGHSLQDGYTVENGLITNGTWEDVIGVVRNDENFRDADLLSAGWNAQWQLGDAWTAEVDLSHSSVDREDILLETYSGSKTEGDTINVGVAAGAGATFNGTLDYTNPSIIQLTSPRGWGGDIVPGGQLGYYNNPKVEDDLNQLKLSAEKFMDGAISGMEFGINLLDREKSLDRDEFFLALADGSEGIPIPFETSITSLEFLGIPGMISYSPVGALNSGIYDLRPNPNSDVVIKSWSVEEEVITPYVKFDFDTSWGDVPVTGNFGVQVVLTDQSSDAQAATGSGDNVTVVDITGGTDYTEVLPSANVNFEVGEDAYVRVGLARTLARPRMDQMRASAQYGFNLDNLDSTDINRSPWSASGGNPELEPWIANSLDVSYEKYFADGTGYFSGAVFYKDLESYVFDETTVFDFSAFPENALGPALTEGLVTVPRNGEGGDNKGVELALSLTGEMFSEALVGFGAILNYSYTDSGIISSQGNAETPLPGLSEDVANLTLYYEDYGWSFRVSNRYRSDFLGEVSGFGDGRTFRTVEAESVVDAQIGYSFSGAWDGISVLLQANNLTDEEFTTINSGDPRQVIDYQRYGRTYLVGLSFRY